MMKKQEIYHCLKRKGIWYEITEHKAVYNMAELSEIEMPYPQADAKNLFIRDDKKRNYYLLTVKGDKRVDLKGFRQSNHTRPLRCFRTGIKRAYELISRLGDAAWYFK